MSQHFVDILRFIQGYFVQMNWWNESTEGYFSTAACLINTILIFIAYLVKKDFPLKSLLVVGKYFRK